MKSLRYRASVAAIVLSSVVISQASLGKHSFGSTMIASALSRFHGVKNTATSHPVTVATVTRVDDGKFTMEPPKPKMIGGPVQDSTPTKPLNDSDPEQGAQKKDDKPVVTPTKTGGSTTDSTQKNTGGTPAGTGQTGTGTGAGTAGGTSTPPAQTPKPQPAAPNGLVSNIYSDTDIKAVMSDVASQAGVTIIPDESIKEQNVSIEFKNEPIDSVIEKLALMAGAYWKEKKPGLYIVSKAAPDSSMFREFAETKMYRVANQPAATIQLLLSASYKNYVSVDPKTNEIGVSAPRQLLDKIMADIKQADLPGRQIVVEALITEMSVDEALNSGFSFSGRNLSLGSDLSLNYQPGGFTDLVKIQAAINNHKASLRANPRIMTTEGNEATISVGTDNYFSLLSGSTTFPTSQIQLIHTGVILKYTAFVDSEGYITMLLDPNVSDAVTLQNGNPQNQVRSASTKVRVKSGESIIIGGLIQQSTDRQIVRVPILGYIPIIGELFTQRTTDKKKIETIIAITPTLVPEVQK